MAILSFDIGTSTISALLVKDNKKVKDISIRINTHVNDKEMTQDAKFILESVKSIIHQMSKIETISYVVLSTPMHTLLYLDDMYNPVDEMIIWSDRRSEYVFDSLSSEVKKELYERTGVPLHSMSPFSKLLKTKNRKGYISDLKAFIMMHLTGNYVTDFSNASASGLWNIKTKCWDEQCLNFAGITETQLPRLLEINECVKGKGYQVVIGATDGVMSNLILGEKNAIVVNIGTSVGVRMLSNKPILNKGFCYYAGFDNWLIGNASNNGGNVYEWVNTTYCDSQMTFNDMVETMSDFPITDKLCIPYVFGERGPWWIDGLSYHGEIMSKKDRVQSLIFAMLTNVYLMISKLNPSNNYIFATGGFLNDTKMKQMFCDFMGYNVLFLVEDQAVNQAGINLVITSKLSLEYEKYIPNYNEEYLEYRNKSSKYIHDYIKEFTRE